MDILEMMINKTESFSEYRHLRNYVLYRNECINSNNEKISVEMPEEITRKYIKTYEELADLLFLNAKYADYKKTIESNIESVIFSSKRLDGIRIKLLCEARGLGLYITAEPYPRLERRYNNILEKEILGVRRPNIDDSVFGITTILDEYNAPKTYFFLGINLTEEGSLISTLSTKIPDMIGEEISGKIQTIGIIPMAPPNN